MKRLKVAMPLAAVSLLAPLLVGCTQTVALDPAPGANDPGCAEVIVRLPDSVGDALTQRATNAQATSAWGSPASVILRCGIALPQVTSLECMDVSGVDWLLDDSRAPDYRFITYGRSPATEVIVDSRAASGAAVLADLSSSIQALPATKHCTNPVQH